VLWCTATQCNTLQHTATHYNTLQHTATHCSTLQHTATHYNTPQHIVTRVLWCAATRYHELQHTATHCNALQHTTTRCNTLQHTIKHCNTLQQSVCSSARCTSRLTQNWWCGVVVRLCGWWWCGVVVWMVVLWWCGVVCCDCGVVQLPCVFCGAKGAAPHQNDAIRARGAECCRVLQSVAMFCSVLQCAAVCCSVLICFARPKERHRIKVMLFEQKVRFPLCVYTSVRCSVRQCVAVYSFVCCRCNVPRCFRRVRVLWCVAVYRSVLQCIHSCVADACPQVARVVCVFTSKFQCTTICCTGILQCTTTCCSSMLQCTAMCCTGMLQCTAMF